MRHFFRGGACFGSELIAPPAWRRRRAVAYIGDDELVEVTPKVVRIRKNYLDPHERKRASRKAEAA